MESQITERPVRVAVEFPPLMAGNLSLPAGAQGIILCALTGPHHSTGQLMAHALNDAGWATLRLDLLTPEEKVADDRLPHVPLDITLLAERLAGAIDWLTSQPETRAFNIGLFGEGLSAGVALVAAAYRPQYVGAVVSQAGRPDLAGSALAYIQAPTLLMVGGRDLPLLLQNRYALTYLQTEKQLKVIPGATRFFEEAGALDQAAVMAHQWFKNHLARSNQ